MANNGFIDMDFEVDGQGRRTRISLDQIAAQQSGAGPKFWPRLIGIKKRAKDLRKVWPEVHEELLHSERIIFKHKGRGTGSTWPEYTKDEQAYLAMKRKFVPNASKRLMRWKAGRERLFPSLVSKTAPYHVFNTSKLGIEFGTSLPYAKGHHEGTGKGWKGKYTVPKRKLVGISAARKKRIIGLIQGYIMDGDVKRNFK